MNMLWTSLRRDSNWTPWVRLQTIQNELVPFVPAPRFAWLTKCNSPPVPSSKPMQNVTQAAANEIQPPVRLDPYDEAFAAQNTILVVEDEAFVREAACDILEGEGYRVLRAHDAAEAQAAFRRQKGAVQLLLSDV